MSGFRPSPSPASAPAVSKAFESDRKPANTPARKTYSVPIPLKPSRTNPFDDEEDDEEEGGRSVYSSTSRIDAGKTTPFDGVSVQELQVHAVNRAEETTNSVYGCLRIVEDIREDATRTLETLNHQGEQITRTHLMAVDIEHDLSRGEKLLSSLGGMFSRPWRPKWTREITGPLTTYDNTINPASKEQRENLGMAPAFKGRSRSPSLEPTNAMQKIEVERAKQDDALSDLSNLLGELKVMATDMGSEISRENKALNHVSDDVDELNTRVQGANRRAHYLLRK